MTSHSPVLLDAVAVRHYDASGDAEALRGERHALPIIAARRGDDRRVVLVLAPDFGGEPAG
jgi:hypothetical protein